MSVAQLMLDKRRGSALRRVASLGPVTVVAASLCVLFVLVAIFGPWIAPHDPVEIGTAGPYAPPSPQHWLGTDDSGRDLLSRLFVGARVSLAGPALVILLAAVLATALAIAAAWHGGWIDSLISRVIEVTFSFPGLVLAVVAAAIFGAGFLAPVLALSVAYVPVLARVLRASALKERSLPYIEALQVQGASAWSICIRHLLPNLMPLIAVQCAVGFGYALLDLAAISYLGLGTQPPAPDWGVMVANGQPSIVSGYPQQSLFAVVVVVVSVVSFNLVGEALARRFGHEDRT
ncbi:ABC transporter permease [Nonomuraea sp. NPDC049269]|uniref:ABC transporter permease n=1 Tax=Nonomuraea sp. NPDC049269 TaxID=3364349 RepID=UPI003717F853